MTGKEFSLDLENFQVAGLSFGDPKAKTKLLCLHGWLDNAASFTPVGEILSEKDIYLLAIDLPGHGDSFHLGPEAHYHMLDSIYFIEKLRLALSWKKISFLSHSLGAVLSGIYAGCFPENVELLISIEALGPISAPVEVTHSNIRRYVDKKIRLDHKKHRPHPSIESGVKARIREGRIQATEAKLLVERGMRKESAETYFWKADPRLSLPSSYRLTEDQVMDVLSRIECPYYLIKGSEEFSLLAKALKFRAKAVKNFKVAEFKGGHHVHMEAPVEVANHVLDILGVH